MNRTTTEKNSRLSTWGTLGALLVAASVSLLLGGAVGVGAMAGFLLGAATGLWGVHIQKRTAATRPRFAFHAYLIAFSIKLFTMVGATLAVRFVDFLYVRADWRAFLVGYAAAALVVLVAGTPEAVRAFKRSIAPTVPSDGPAPESVESHS